MLYTIIQATRLPSRLSLPDASKLLHELAAERLTREQVTNILKSDYKLSLIQARSTSKYLEGLAKDFGAFGS